MRKYLYGTTSLVGVGLLASVGASPAQAEPQPIHLQLGGFFHQWQGIVDTDHCQHDGRKSDCNDLDIVQVGEVYFKISGELDNGLEIGGRIELETQQDADVIDAARVDISGPFGSIQLGQEDSARHNWAFDTAAPNEGILINSGWETAFAATSQHSAGLLRPTHSTALDFSDKAPKLTYFTPRLGGFQFAASWTPDTQADIGSSPFGAADSGSLRFGTANEEQTYTNAIDIAAHYSGELNGVGITAQAGFGTVDAPDVLRKWKSAIRELEREYDAEGAAESLGLDVGNLGDDPKIYQAGLALSYRGFTVAGGYSKIDDGQYLHGDFDVDNEGRLTQASVNDWLENGIWQNTEGHSWTIGAGYSIGPWAFSTGYLHGREKGSIFSGGSDENDFFQVSASYALSPGVGLNAQYLRIEREADTDDLCIEGARHSCDSDTDAFMLGVKVGF
jgi:predicted porin